MSCVTLLYHLLFELFDKNKDRHAEDLEKSSNFERITWFGSVEYMVHLYGTCESEGTYTSMYPLYVSVA